MRFGERLTVNSPVAHRRRWQRYWRHLSECGFSARDEVYRLFAGEVFHDGELTVGELDVPRHTVALSLRNVHAVNAVTASDAYTARPVPLDRRHFLTALAFSGVENVTLRTDAAIRRPIYHSAELGRAEGRTSIDIALADADIHGVRGRLRITFSAVEIEDITAKIARYVPGWDARMLLTPIDRDPVHYLDPVVCEKG